MGQSIVLFYHLCTNHILYTCAFQSGRVNINNKSSIEFPYLTYLTPSIIDVNGPKINSIIRNFLRLLRYNLSILSQNTIPFLSKKMSVHFHDISFLYLLRLKCILITLIIVVW